MFIGGEQITETQRLEWASSLLAYFWKRFRVTDTAEVPTHILGGQTPIGCSALLDVGCPCAISKTLLEVV